MVMKRIVGAMKTKGTPDKRGWERVVPPLEKRNWYTVDEVASILLREGVVHKDEAQNKNGIGEITGEQQVRKYIRKGELEAILYDGSKKYGYIIFKDEVPRFVEMKKKELRDRYMKYLEKLQ